MYGFAKQKPRKQAEDNEYWLAEGLGKVVLSEDDPGEFYDDIEDFKKDATNDVADEPIYEILDSSLEEKTSFSFTNSGFQWGSDGLMFGDFSLLILTSCSSVRFSQNNFNLFALSTIWNKVNNWGIGGWSS